MKQRFQVVGHMQVLRTVGMRVAFVAWIVLGMRPLHARIFGARNGLLDVAVQQGVGDDSAFGHKNGRLRIRSPHCLEEVRIVTPKVATTPFAINAMSAAKFPIFM